MSDILCSALWMELSKSVIAWIVLFTLLESMTFIWNDRNFDWYRNCSTKYLLSEDLGNDIFDSFLNISITYERSSPSLMTFTSGPSTVWGKLVKSKSSSALIGKTVDNSRRCSSLLWITDARLGPDSCSPGSSQGQKECINEFKWKEGMYCRLYHAYEGSPSTYQIRYSVNWSD